LLFTYVIAREKQRKLRGSGAITDGETDAKNASVDEKTDASAFSRIADGITDAKNDIGNGPLCGRANTDKKNGAHLRFCASGWDDGRQKTARGNCP
jgi:hypothetical protein